MPNHRVFRKKKMYWAYSPLVTCYLLYAFLSVGLIIAYASLPSFIADGRKSVDELVTGRDPYFVSTISQKPQDAI